MRTILKILIMLFGVVSYAQTTVTGTITDQSDQPLSGATVIVVGQLRLVVVQQLILCLKTIQLLTRL